MEMRLEYMNTLRPLFARRRTGCGESSPALFAPGPGSTAAVSGARRLVRAPGVEAVRGRRPGELFEGRQALFQEERGLGGLLRRDAQLAAGDVSAVVHDEDREARAHPHRHEAVETHVEAGLLLRLADRCVLRRLVSFDEPARQRPLAIARPVVQAD